MGQSKENNLVMLIGNPNSGKSTIFNYLTGAHQHVGNYAGVTVERYEGYCFCNEVKYSLVDLPGIYSLSPQSIDQQIACREILDGGPDFLVNIVDAANIERNLYLTLQLLEMEIPMVVVLNMIDVAEKNCITVSAAALTQVIHLPVLSCSGNTGKGLDLLLQAINQLQQKSEFMVKYDDAVEKWINKLIEVMDGEDFFQVYPKRWLALKFLENDSYVLDRLIRSDSLEKLLSLAADARQEIIKRTGMDAVDKITETRYEQAHILANQVSGQSKSGQVDITDKIDKILVNRCMAMPIFFLLMWGLFNVVFTAGGWLQEWLSEFIGIFGKAVTTQMPEGIIRALIEDGIIGGVGNVLSFLPNIMLLFAGIAFMEDSGYMSRVAFVMDRIMRSIGLQGRAIIPLLLGAGCTVPAIISTRLLNVERERWITILILPFISCSARLPVYTLLIGTFFSTEWAGTILFAVYMLGIICAMLTAYIFKLFNKEKKSYLCIIELPKYHIPAWRNLMLRVWERTLFYLKRAATTILTVSVCFWFMTNYPVAATQQDTLANSYAAQIGKVIEPLIAPLGFDWRIGVSLLTAIAAKELIISTLGTLYNVEADEDNMVLLGQALAADPMMSVLTGLALLVFSLLYSPCMAALVVIWKETSFKWMAMTMIYTCCAAWLAAYIVVNAGHLLGVS